MPQQKCWGFFVFFCTLPYLFKIRYLSQYGVPEYINNTLLRFTIILFPKNKFKEKTYGKIRFAKRSNRRC
jgi:hypothetical protein